MCFQMLATCKIAKLQYVAGAEIPKKYIGL
jgi:hypothetical protein